MEKEKSLMLAVPSGEADIREPEKLLERLQAAEDFQVTSRQWENESYVLKILYREEVYPVQIYPTEFETPPLYRCQHLFPDVDIEQIEQSRIGLAVELMFGSGALASYHLQLKIIHAMLPDALAVLDASSEKILSGKWVALAAESHVPPAPRYIYTAQAVSGDDGCVWLHTHGMNRCGLTELEVLDSTSDTYQEHYNVLETLANRMLELEEPLEPGEPFFLARLGGNVDLVVTLMEWDKAVEAYPPGLLGGREDRSEGHNGNTCVVFVYASEEEYREGNCRSLSIYDDILKDNPIYMLTTSETERMKALAVERAGYLYGAAEDRENHILLKIGLKVDEEYRDNRNEREHIWFELLSVKDGRFTAKLTQAPYYVSGIREGDTGEYGVEDITDWIIYTPEGRITPDDVYLLLDEAG